MFELLLAIIQILLHQKSIFHFSHPRFCLPLLSEKLAHCSNFGGG